MKIAFIGSRGFPGIMGGVEKMLEQVCPRLAARGHRITIYCSPKVTTGERVYRGVILKRMPAINTKHLETISRVFLAGCDALFRDEDVVHYHSIGPALLSWMTRLKTKTVVTVHGLDWQRAKWNRFAKTLLRFGEMSAVIFPHRTIVVSRPLLKHYWEAFGKKVTYIPNGVTIEAPIPPYEISKKWGLMGKDYFLFVSRLVPEKGCHTLIDAFKNVGTDKKLVIAGASWHSDRYVEELKELAKGHPEIIFTGWAEGRLLQELFSNAYAYCLPSEIEGLSLSLLEAMSYGACPLVSDIPENTDVVGGAAARFHVRDVKDLAEALRALTADPLEAARLGQAAKMVVANEYDWDRVADAHEQFYRELIEAR